jgi:tetratricopeptide (TPR) repeat protein
MRGCAVLALLLACASARADEDRAAAKVHFDAGQSHYTAGRWGDADREFKEAYRLSHLPDLLLDMARAESKQSDDAQAIRHLEQYLDEKPDADDAPSVRAEIEQRKRAIGQAAEASRARADAEAARRRADAEAARADAEARRTHARPRWPSYGLFALGGAAVVGGVILGVAAVNRANLVASGGTHSQGGMPVDFGTADNASFLSAQTLGQRYAAAGIALDAVGGAMLVAAVGLIVWATRPAGEAPKRALLEAAPGGLAVRF